MKRKRILAMILAVASYLSLAVSASAANTTARKATDFKDYDAKSWYAEAVSAAVAAAILQACKNERREIFFIIQ